MAMKYKPTSKQCPIRSR